MVSRYLPGFRAMYRGPSKGSSLYLMCIDDVDFAIMPFGFTFEQWQPLPIAGILFRALRIRPIRLPALEHHRYIVVVRVSIRAIGVACYKPRDLAGFKGTRLLSEELSELAFHPCFDA